MLSKSSYLKYRQCPRYLWLWEHRRAEVEAPLDLASEWRIEEGQRVEEIARTLFANGKRVKSFHERGAERTKRFMEKREPCLFQATAIGDGLLAMADVLRFDPSLDAWDILEVKSSTSVKDTHLHDVTFQRLAFERAGYRIGKTAVIHVERTYIRSGAIDVSRFLAITDVSQESDAIREEVEAGIMRAKAVLGLRDAPTLTDFPCDCSPKDCPCSSHCFPALPPHSIFFLSRITTKKARSYYESGVRTLSDIPSETKLTGTRKLQVQAARNGAPIIDRAGIKRTLDSLAYPLYFLDYETFAASVPPFDNFKPSQAMPFQYSVHVMETATAEPTHFEYLAPEFGNTIPDLVRSLRSHIGDGGTVIVWNKKFESGRNDEMAMVSPGDAPFLTSINERMFDLMDIFSKQLYVDVQFDGSCSIKKVLPVLVPSLSYKDLPIREGMAASVSWFRMFRPGTTAEEMAQTRKNLRDYCGLDTLAMVEILRRLQKIVAAA